jgi:predicted GNAT family acetyltransferase
LNNVVRRSKLNSRDQARLLGLKARHGLNLPGQHRRGPKSILQSTKGTMSTINHDQGAHRFTTEVDGSRAELVYTLADGVMTITHTGVPSAIGGRGIAAELMEAALSAARAAGWSVIPACSYAKSYMEKHPQGPKHPQVSDKQHIDELLDEALEESFPASDSPAVGGSS